MSVYLVTHAFKVQNLTCPQKCVLIALCDMSKDVGNCWPSVNTLARMCSLSVRCIQNCVKELCKKGLIFKQSRTRENLSDTSNCYEISIENLVQEEEGGGEPRAPQNAPGAPHPPHEVHPQNHKKEYIDLTDVRSRRPTTSTDFLQHQKNTCPYQKILEIFHRILPTLPKVQILNDFRKRHLKSRWIESEQHQSVDFWEQYFLRVSHSDFLMGKINTFNRTPFLATFDWLIRPMNFAKVIDGNYGNRKQQSCGALPPKNFYVDGRMAQ